MSNSGRMKFHLAAVAAGLIAAASWAAEKTSPAPASPVRRDAAPRRKKAASERRPAAPRPEAGRRAPLSPPLPPGIPCSFRPPAGWGGPELLPDEQRYLEPGGEAFISVAFHETASPGYKEPSEFRRIMRQLGAVEDPHTIDTVLISDRFGSRARYTTYYYPRTKLLGQTHSVFFTEMIMVPDSRGIYVLRYQAAKESFEKHRPAYLAFLASLSLPRSYDPPEQYYLDQAHVMKELMDAAPLEKESRGPEPG